MTEEVYMNHETQTKISAVCFSVAALDYFPLLNQSYAGGNSLNQAVRFALAGYNASFIGALGDDEAGKSIMNLMKKAHVNTTHTVMLRGKTASNRIINDEHGERFGEEGAWNSGVYDSFIVREEDWNYCKSIDIWATHANGANYDEALKRKRDNNFLSVDFLHFNTFELLEKGLDTIDIAYFGGTDDMEESLCEISKKTKTIIVLTLGAKGSIAFIKGKKFRQSALVLDKVIDTTGCGDAFQAGCTASFLQTGSIEKALYEGAVQGHKAASHYGGVPWL